MIVTAGIEGDSFFFQAEDGIRDLTVTGVQTCALPILGVVFLAGCQRICKIGQGMQPGTVHFFDDLHQEDRKSTRLNSSHSQISYAVFCLKKKKKEKYIKPITKDA